jgi:FHA domain
MEWHVEFLRDPDGELNEGDILVDSELLLPPPPDLGAGDRTRRVTTRHFRQPEAPAAAAAQRVSTRVETIDRPAVTTSAVHARLRYEDNSGVHSYDIAKDSVTVGRGGLAYRVDVRVEASADVSREHLRIRRDPATNRFYLLDLSSLGTTVDGARVAKGYEEADGTKRENGVETPLPPCARIGLADTVFIDFEVTRR